MTGGGRPIPRPVEPVLGLHFFFFLVYFRVYFLLKFAASFRAEFNFKWPRLAQAYIQVGLITFAIILYAQARPKAHHPELVHCRTKASPISLSPLLPIIRVCSTPPQQIFKSHRSISYLVQPTPCSSSISWLLLCHSWSPSVVFPTEYVACPGPFLLFNGSIAQSEYLLLLYVL